MPAEREVGLDALLEGDQPQLLQARDLSREILMGEIGQRRPAPERQGLAELFGGDRGFGSTGVADELLEAGQVELVRADLEHVARRAGDQGVRAERPAQPPDLDLHDLRGGRRRTFVPETVDQRLGGDDFVRPQQKQREQRALLRTAERHRPVLVDHLERSEDAVVHVAPSVAGGA